MFEKNLFIKEFLQMLYLERDNMLKIKLQGLESIIFNSKPEVRGSVKGYTMEHLELEGKLCETSTIIYPTAQYKSNEDKFIATCTELSCNEEVFVSFDSTNELVEYVEYQIHITTEELMKEIERVEAE